MIFRAVSSLLGYRLAVLAVVTIASFTLAPIVSAGLSGDDVYRAHLAAFGREQHLGIGATALSVMRQNQAEGTPLAPLAILPLLWWASGVSPVIVKMCQLALVLAALVIAIDLARRITASTHFALAAGISSLAAFSLRAHDDAVLGTSLSMPLCLCFLFAALSLWTRYAQSFDRRALVATAVAVLLGVLADPVAVVLPVALIVDTFVRGRRLALAAGTLSVLAVATIVLAHESAALRIPAVLGSSGAEAVHNVLAPLPTASRALGDIVPDGVTATDRDTRYDGVPPVTRLGWLITLSASLMLFGAVRYDIRASRPRNTALRSAAALGLVLWLVPAFVLRAWDVPAAVLAQSIGVGFFVSAVMFAVMGRLSADRRLAFAAACALFTGVVVYGNVRTNARVIALTGRTDAARVYIARAARFHVFDDIPSGSRIVVDPSSYPFRTSRDAGYRSAAYLFSDYVGKRYAVVSRQSILPRGLLCRTQRARRCAAADTRTWILANDRPPGAITLLRWRETVGDVPRADEAHAYALYGNARQARHESSWSRARPEGVRISAVPLTPVVYRFDGYRRCGPVPVGRMWSAQPAQWRWRSGFLTSPLLRRLSFPGAVTPHAAAGGMEEWRFAGPGARFEIAPATCGSRRIALSLRAYTALASALTVRIGAAVRVYHTGPGGVGVNLLLSPRNAPTTVQLTTDARPDGAVWFDPPRLEGVNERRVAMLLTAPDAFVARPHSR